MFDELNKYKETDHFFLNPTDALAEVCNAPSDKNGVYIVYTLKKGRVDLSYIGSSGKKLSDGSIKTRKGGIKDSLINGHQFGKLPRKKSWPIKMLCDDIEALDIYWWITCSNKYDDCPLTLENLLLRKYWDIHGRLPEWNKKFS